jgi:nitrite reductase/ring-hydroxylating ferredoxin subunit
MSDDIREQVDARIDSPAREGLAGTTPANMYGPLQDAEQVTMPPDWRPMEEQPAWRTDFPIDWPQDHYVERRELTKFMVLTSLAFTVGQFWIAVKNVIQERDAPRGLVRLASVQDVPVGTAQTFAYATQHDPCLLIRPDERTFVAYSQKCTHLSCAVVPDVEHGVIRCPCHNGVFDLASGRPLAGPPQRPLSIVRLQIRGNDIFAAGVEKRMV